MQRMWLAVALALAACSFEGSGGMSGGPDAGSATPRDAAADGPLGPITCEGFVPVGTSRYLLVQQALVPRADAITRCAGHRGGRLATFETLAEIEAIKLSSALSFQGNVWVGIEQTATATEPDQGWVNRVGDLTTALPAGFPWRPSEPNDETPPENGVESYAEMKMDPQQPLPFYGTFDDVDPTRLSRVLCECTPDP